jgi:hypothetical protein
MAFFEIRDLANFNDALIWNGNAYSFFRSPKNGL